MAFKFLFFAACLAVASASVVPLAVETSHVPNYSYAYDVNDALTGDSKSQVETRNGDFVTGQYSLTDSDGTRRTVDYNAGPVTGFNAVVRKDPIAYAAPVVAAAAPAVTVARTVAAPVAAYSAAPAVATYSAAPAVATYSAAPAVAAYSAAPAVATYSSPLAYSAYSSPLAYSAYSAPISRLGYYGYAY